MPSQLELSVGVLSIVVGVTWAIWPVRMRRLQGKVLFLGLAGDDEPTDNEVLLGRISGVALASLGVALAFGLVP